MKMEDLKVDYLYKAIALNDEVKVYVVRSTNLTNQAINRHDLWPSAASVLGKTMTIALMIGGTMKLDEAVTVKLNGNGPIGYVCADADTYGHVRGYVQNPHVNFTNKQGLDEVTTLGYNGFIDVIKDLHLENLFSSSIEIGTGDLAKDFTYYFAKSEQTPSAILLGSKFDPDNTCKICGGVLIQLLPNASEETITYLENKLNELNEFSNILIDNPDLEDILKLLFNDNYKLLSKVPVFFECFCTKDRFKQGLLTLQIKDLEEMISEGKDIETVCHYCNEHYEFSVDELKEILELKKKGNK